MKPQCYMVSLEIETEELTLDELSSLVGVEADDNSLSKEIDGKFTVWRFDSKIENDNDLDDHFQALSEQIDIPEILKANLPADADIYLNIGVLYYSMVCGFLLPVDWMQFFAENKIRIMVSCYPCSDEEEQPEEATH